MYDIILLPTIIRRLRHIGEDLINKAKRIVVYSAAMAAIIFILSAGSVVAVGPSLGHLILYPCDSCHPVGEKQPPVNFEGHTITLSYHDKLAPGREACLVCHFPANQDPGVLKVGDGSTIRVTDNVSIICYRCHNQKYKEWQAGIHGRLQPSCNSQNCHNPHTPNWVGVMALPPYLPDTRIVDFIKPSSIYALPAPPPDLPIETPTKLRSFAVALYTVAAILIIIPMILSRFSRRSVDG